MRLHAIIHVSTVEKTCCNLEIQKRLGNDVFLTASFINVQTGVTRRLEVIIP